MSRSFLTNINLNKNELQNAAIQTLSQAPLNPVTGQVYFDSVIGNLRQFNGTIWLDYVTTESGNEYIQSVGDNLDVTSQELTLGAKVVITDSTQTLTNKTLGDAGNGGAKLGADLDAQNTRKIVNLVDPVNPQDAATKHYVDATAQGLSVLGSVRTATTNNITDFSAVGPAAVISGVTLQNGDRVLVKAQDDATENGIYIYNNATFALDASTVPSDLAIKEGSYALVEEGTYAAQGWIVTAYVASASTWTQFSAAGEYLAGTNISLADNTISVTGQIAIVNGGTGANNATDARANLGATTKVVANNSALTATSGSVTWVITHGLGNQDVTIQVRKISTNELVEVDVVLTDLNTVTLSWNSGDVSADTFRAVIVG